MVSNPDALPDLSTIDEGEIFKTLSHEIRRKIVKVLGKREKLSFTDLKKEIGSVDSPTLAYHLKSMKFLVDQKNTQYYLTEVGKAALFLMGKIDQTEHMKDMKRKFLYAVIVTFACWIFVAFAIPIYIAQYISESARIPIVIVLNVVFNINFSVIVTLWNISWRSPSSSKINKKLSDTPPNN